MIKNIRNFINFISFDLVKGGASAPSALSLVTPLIEVLWTRIFGIDMHIT